MQKVYAAYDNGEDIYSIMREVNTSNMSLEQKEGTLQAATVRETNRVSA